MNETAMYKFEIGEKVWFIEEYWYSSFVSPKYPSIEVRIKYGKIVGCSFIWRFIKRFLNSYNKSTNTVCYTIAHPDRLGNEHTTNVTYEHIFKDRKKAIETAKQIFDNLTIELESEEDENNADDHKNEV